MSKKSLRNILFLISTVVAIYCLIKKFDFFIFLLLGVSYLSALELVYSYNAAKFKLNMKNFFYATGVVEPSEFYIGMIRLEGIVLFVLSLYLMIFIIKNI